MKIEDLVKLNLDELEGSLKDLGAQSSDFVGELIAAEKSGKDRDGAYKIIREVFGSVDTVVVTAESQEPDSEKYTIKKGASIVFRAGIKQHGDEIDFDWPEFQRDETMQAEMIKSGTLVKM